MADSATIGAPLLDQNVAQPEIPHNEAINVIDAAIAKTLELDVNADTDYTLENIAVTYPQEWQNGILLITNTGTANTAEVSVLIPDGLVMKYVLINDTGSGFDVRLETVTGSGIPVPDGSIYSLYCDGTNVRRIN